MVRVKHRGSISWQNFNHCVSSSFQNAGTRKKTLQCERICQSESFPGKQCGRAGVSADIGLETARTHLAFGNNKYFLEQMHVCCSQRQRSPVRVTRVGALLNILTIGREALERRVGNILTGEEEVVDDLLCKEWVVGDHCQCSLDRFTNELFWNFKKCRAVSMEAYPYKQMPEKKFFPNVAPSPGSGPPLIYKAKYKGLISKNQYPAITFDWSVLWT